MFNPGNYFHLLFLIPILNLLIAFYKLFLFLRIPSPFGFALISLTFLIRFFLNPLMTAQIKSSQKLSQLKPKLEKLAREYKNDKWRLQQEQLKLYQKAGVNPAAGCLPLLIQMPILLALYNLFFTLLGTSNLPLVVEEINKVVLPFLKISFLDLSFFGLNLAQKPSQWQSAGWGWLLIPFLTGLLQYWQSKMMILPSPSFSSVGGKEKPFPPSEKKSEKKEEEIGEIMQKQMTLMMPLLIGFFSYSLPLGLSLYWNIFTLFGIISQRQLKQSLVRAKNDEENLH